MSATEVDWLKLQEVKNFLGSERFVLMECVSSSSTIASSSISLP